MLKLCEKSSTSNHNFNIQFMVRICKICNIEKEIKSGKICNKCTYESRKDKIREYQQIYQKSYTRKNNSLYHKLYYEIIKIKEVNIIRNIIGHITLKRKKL